MGAEARRVMPEQALPFVLHPDQDVNDFLALESHWWLHFGKQLARSGVHYYAGLPPLPKGRKPRRREHARRWLTIYRCRQYLIERLRLRFVYSVRPRLQELPPRPKHGRSCGPGQCLDCTALRRWREQAAAAAGIPVDSLISLGR